MRGRESREAVQFAVWGCAGAALALALLTAPTIGVFLAPVGIALVVMALRLGPGSPTAVGVLLGVGVVLLCIAWLNRDGPGTVCVRSATEESCTEQWSPWPWLGAGLLLVLAPVAAVAWWCSASRRGHGRVAQG